MEHTFQTLIGEDLPVDVEFDYTPGEPMILNPPDRADPGCDAEVEILAVTCNGIDFERTLNEATIDMLEQECFAHIKGLQDEEPEFDSDDYMRRGRF
jgi:hypothetical protein